MLVVFFLFSYGVVSLFVNKFQFIESFTLGYSTLTYTCVQCNTPFRSAFSWNDRSCCCAIGFSFEFTFVLGISLLFSDPYSTLDVQHQLNSKENCLDFHWSCHFILKQIVLWGTIHVTQYGEMKVEGLVSSVTRKLKWRGRILTALILHTH